MHESGIDESGLVMVPGFMLKFSESSSGLGVVRLVCDGFVGGGILPAPGLFPFPRGGACSEGGGVSSGMPPEILE